MKIKATKIIEVEVFNLGDFLRDYPETQIIAINDSPVIYDCSSCNIPITTNHRHWKVDTYQNRIVLCLECKGRLKAYLPEEEKPT